MTTETAPDGGVAALQHSLIDYPCVFPVKVLGAQAAGFEDAMVAVAGLFDRAFDRNTVERRPSKAGKYLGLTLHVHVDSRQQLDDLYRALSSHPMVRVVL